MEVEVHNQAELDAAIRAGNTAICVSGELKLTTTGSESPRLIVRAGASLRVEARESSQPRVVAWESSQPRVEAWESSQPRVEAWESSQPRVEARGYVMLSLFGRVIAKLSANVSCHIEGKGAEVEGGKQTIAKQPTTAAEWCEFYGVEVVDDVAILYKAVDDDYRSPHRFAYTPGTVPEAPDWDGGKAECGGGLHFCPYPRLAQVHYFSSATKFIACPVRLEDIVVHENPEYPNKVKAARCCAPVWECDEDGERLEVAETKGTA